MNFFGKSVVIAFFLPIVGVVIMLTTETDLLWLMELSSLYFFIGGGIYLVLDSKKLKKIQQKQLEKEKGFNFKFKIPKRAHTVHYAGKAKDFPCEFLQVDRNLTEGEKLLIKEESLRLYGVSVWIQDDFLTFFSKPHLYDLESKIEEEVVWFSQFSMNKVKCFYRQGDTYTDTKISGGGSSLGGAIVGGMIAGEAGAVIGSRQEIKSETKFIDKRSTILVIEDSSTSKDHFLIFDTNAYDVFLEIIPTKEKSYIEFNSNTSNTNKPTNGEQEVIDLLIKYKQLKDNGVITDEEFEKKKNELLNT